MDNEEESDAPRDVNRHNDESELISMETFQSLVLSWKQKYVLPLNKDNILYYYVPGFGVASFHLLALSVMNPKLVTNILKR